MSVSKLLYQPSFKNHKKKVIPSNAASNAERCVRPFVSPTSGDSARPRQPTQAAASVLRPRREVRRISGAHVLSRRWGWGAGMWGTIPYRAGVTSRQGSVVYASLADRCGTAGDRRRGGRRPARKRSIGRGIQNKPNTASHLGNGDGGLPVMQMFKEI